MKKEIKFIVPDSLEEISLGDYQSYLASIDGLDQHKDVQLINKKLIETFCGVEMSQVDLLPFKAVESALEVLTGAFKEEYELIRMFNIQGTKMGFIPKLDDMTLGEYIDLDSYFGDWENMHKAMAVLYRVVNFEKGEKYSIVPYDANEDLQELMKVMPLSVVMSCMVFFYRLGTELAKAMSSYIQKTIHKQKGTTSHLKEALEQNGVGINQFTDSLKEMSEDLTRLQNYRYTNV